MALTAQEMLDKYLQAEADVLAGKDVQFNGRRVVMSDLPAIRTGRLEWERRVAVAQRGASGLFPGDLRLNLLDKALAPLFPCMVAERLRARNVIMAFEAATVTRTHKAKKQPRSADGSLNRTLKSLREQCRKLDEDHDIVTGLFDRLEERVVGGPGIAVEPIPLGYDGNVHVDFAAAIKALWGEWSLTPESSGELSRPQMERLVCRTWLRDGETLAQKLIGKVPGYEHLHGVPFALELLEPDYLPI